MLYIEKYIQKDLHGMPLEILLENCSLVYKYIEHHPYSGAENSAEWIYDDGVTRVTICRAFCREEPDVRNGNVGSGLFLRWNYKLYAEGKKEDTVFSTSLVYLNKVQKQEYCRNKRRAQMDYLVSSSIGKPSEPYVAALIEHYLNDMEGYVLSGSSFWAEKIKRDGRPDCVPDAVWRVVVVELMKRIDGND